MAIERPRRFYFYGTLIGGGPPPVRRALARLRDLGPARTGGLLYAIVHPAGSLHRRVAVAIAGASAELYRFNQPLRE